MNLIWSQITDTGTVETIFRWGRIQENRDWFLPILVTGLLVVYFARRYRIDAAELKVWQRTILLLLRTAAIFGLLLFYLHPQWEHLVGSSRVAVMIDSSASMGQNNEQQDENNTKKDELGAMSPVSRIKTALDWLQQSNIIAELSKKHDVVLYSFDATLRKLNDTQNVPPDGSKTALGDALFDLLQQERGQPLAGIVLLSDGGQNAGREVAVPLETAERLRIPIYSIGIGQTTLPLNFRLGNVSVPDRAFPGDPFTVTVPVERIGGSETESYTVPIELWTASQTAGDSAQTKIGEKSLKFTKNGTVEEKFEVKIAEPGKQRITVKILPPKEDHTPTDNQQQANVEVVDRKDRVLLFASAPSRDYQFLCTQIFRDKTMSADVYLPWSQTGISQNADKILERFPTTRAEMSEYDIVIAFDPNWRELSTEQIDVLEFWVARQGGGLILAAGSVNQADTITGWVADIGMEKIRALYPVEFLAKQSAFDHRYHGDVKPWELKFSRAGEEADFLKPMDNVAESRSFWDSFPGFYGFFAVKGIKPTATLLISSGSPETLGRTETGALLVEQFYGAGRVLYLGSGELWRLRKVDEKGFEQIATKMIRHVGQGRLLRESDRGTLATDKQRYPLGSIAQIRVTANDPQLNPLTVPTLPIEIQTPSGAKRTTEVLLDPNVPGAYQTHVPLTEEGTWSIQWGIPDMEQRLTRTVQVQMSDLERENPSRNEPLLQELATKSGGLYFSTFKEAEVLPKTVKVRSQRVVLDAAAEERQFRFLLIGICITLLAEWTLRRLMRLA